MKLFWTDRARRDLIDIGRYIARDNPRAARAWVERLRLRAKEAAKMPLAGRLVPEKSDEEVREVLLGNYRIVYRAHKKAIQILTVFEGHRLFPNDVVPSPDEDK